MAIKTVTATINGQLVKLTLNGETGRYEGVTTAPAITSYTQSGGYFAVTVSVIDEAGNETTVGPDSPDIGNSLRLVVKERVKPVIEIVSPGQGATINTNIPTIIVKLRDETDGSGIDLNSFRMQINGGAEITKINISALPAEGGYDVTYTPSEALPVGSNRIVVNVSDNDGNAADTAISTFNVGLSAPTLDVFAPTPGLITNMSQITVAGIVSDDTMNSVVVSIAINGQDVGTVDHNTSTGEFSKTITLREGHNTIVVTATDAGGLTSTISRVVELDTVAPSILSASIAPNPVDAGATYTITVEVSD